MFDRYLCSSVVTHGHGLDSAGVFKRKSSFKTSADGIKISVPRFSLFYFIERTSMRYESEFGVHMSLVALCK